MYGPDNVKDPPKCETGSTLKCWLLGRPSSTVMLETFAAWKSSIVVFSSTKVGGTATVTSLSPAYSPFMRNNAIIIIERVAVSHKSQQVPAGIRDDGREQGPTFKLPGHRFRFRTEHRRAYAAAAQLGRLNVHDVIHCTDSATIGTKRSPHGRTLTGCSALNGCCFPTTESVR